MHSWGLWASLGSLCWSKSGQLYFQHHDDLMRIWAVKQQCVAAVNVAVHLVGSSSFKITQKTESGGRSEGLFFIKNHFCHIMWKAWRTRCLMHTESHIAPDTRRACSTHTSCVHTRLSLSSSAAIQGCSATLLRRVINYSLRNSALVQSSWA